MPVEILDTKLFSDSKRTISKVNLNTGGQSGRTYGEAIGDYFGRFHFGLAKSFNNLDVAVYCLTTGW